MLGKSKTEIQQIMSNQFSEYSTNNFGIKSNDNTLRYYNSKKDVTLMFYFNNQQKCKYIKQIEDIDNLEQRTKELNNKYIKVSNYKWKTTLNQKTINISIEKEEYNFSVIFQ
jgi:uncharacterized protein YlaI